MKIGDQVFDEFMDFEVIKEPWNIYSLEDGTFLKIKVILIKVMQDIEKGSYAVNTTNALGILSPNVNKKAPSTNSEDKLEIEMKDMNFKVVEESWNEYKLEDGNILKIKPAIAAIDRTKFYDVKGDPNYLINCQILVKG